MAFLLTLREIVLSTRLRMCTLTVLKEVSFDSVFAVPGSECVKILADFPKITGVSKPTVPRNSDVSHHIISSSPPVSECPRRLAPDKLKAAKAEFDAWIYLHKAFNQIPVAPEDIP